MFNFFIGIDQTGAAGPKPLPIALLDLRESPRLIATALDGRPLRLPIFSRESLETLLVENAVEDAHHLVRSSKTAILIDGVIGLPKSLWPRDRAGASYLRELFARAANRSDGYGRDPAAKFFAEILADSPAAETYPDRECERIANATSVFRTHPYQKNIQCGTYRFWRDLGLDGSEWVHLRYFERSIEHAKRKSELADPASLNRPMLFEAYPSLFWREMLELNTRDRTKIREAIRQASRRSEPQLKIEFTNEDLELIERNADHADSSVLALGGAWLQNKNALIDGGRSRNLNLAREGWIAGLARAT